MYPLTIDRKGLILFEAAVMVFILTDIPHHIWTAIPRSLPWVCLHCCWQSGQPPTLHWSPWSQYSVLGEPITFSQRSLLALIKEYIHGGIFTQSSYISINHSILSHQLPPCSMLNISIWFSETAVEAGTCPEILLVKGKWLKPMFGLGEWGSQLI